MKGDKVTVKLMMRDEETDYFVWPSRVDKRNVHKTLVKKMTEPPREVLPSEFEATLM